MPPTIQRQLLTTLAEVWELAPDVRLGQMMAHLGFLGEDHVGRGLGEIDDDELLTILYRHRAELADRGQCDLSQASSGAAILVTGGSEPSPTTPPSEVSR